MFALTIGMMLALAAGPDDSSVRGRFTQCLKGSLDKAVTAKVDAAGFGAFAKLTCAVEATGFRNSLIAYDMKAGWTRRKAEPDADQQIGDYMDETSGRFKDKAVQPK